jgi:polysaccharide export outer membrane protein
MVRTRRWSARRFTDAAMAAAIGAACVCCFACPLAAQTAPHNVNVPAIPAPTSASGASNTSVVPAGSTPAEEDARVLAGLWPSGRYRITAGDVIQFTFPYVPEFDQTVAVQPDGYISLRGLHDLGAAGRTVPELKSEVLDAYAEILRDPVITLVLKEFEKPYFVIGGEVAHPGKYELRGATTVTQALAIAGGKVAGAKVSDVVLFRRFGNDLVDVKRINVKKMYSKRDLSEDPVLRPNDTLFVPKSTYSKLEPFLPKPSLGFFANPLLW